jgi:hypothetical protein
MQWQPKNVCLVLLSCVILVPFDGPGDAEELSSLSETRERILADLESRWWGWPSEPAPILPAPKWWKLLDPCWQLSPREEVVVATGPDRSLQESYIAEMLRRELTGKYRIECRVAPVAGELSTAGPVICLGTCESSPQVAELCQTIDIEPDVFKRPESYVIEFVDDQVAGRKWILIAGGDSVGCIHGGYSLMQLIRSEGGKVAIEACRVRDYPSVAVRSLRGVGESLGMKLQVHTDSRYLGRKITGDEIHPDELLLPSLDWLARNRINCYHILSGLENGAKLPQRMGHLIEESHRRGIKVVGGFRPVGAQQGDRSTFPCYCNEEHMQIVLGHFRQYIEAGCDFIYFMADDYYSDKLDGHCRKCIDRFGDLAGEQQHMLHRIVDLARDMGMDSHQILFCPTHYDARSQRDIDYLRVFHDDPKLKGIQFTFTYLTEDVIEERKQKLPNLTYALFYNGPRWLAYYYRQSPNTRRVLANYARNAMYFPIYYGWHAAQYSPVAGWFVGTTDAVRRNFHEVIPRETAATTLLGNIANYSDSIFKGPIEYALWGHSCWHPKVHDTRQSEVAIGDVLFGPECGKTLAQLNRGLLDLTRVVYEDVTPPKEFLETLDQRFQLAKLLHQRLKQGYETHCNSVAPDYIPATQDYHAKLGIEDIGKYIAKLEEIVEIRGLLGGKPIIAPSPRYAGVIFPSDEPDSFLVSGGCQGGNLTACLGDLWKYHIPENQWERLEVPAGMMSPRCGHSAVTIGKRVFFFGGTSDRFVKVHNSLHEFDIQKGTFREIAEAQGGPPRERLVHAACADHQGRMWIFGGLTTDRRALDDLWCWHSDENRWESIDYGVGAPPEPRYGTRMACLGDSLYLFGGSKEKGPALNDLYRFEPDERRWTCLETTSGEPPRPRYASAFIAVGQRIYLFGGADGKGGYLNDLYVYDLAADYWKQLAPTGDVPEPRGCPLPLCRDEKRIFLFSGAQSAARFGSWINGDLYVYSVSEKSFVRLRSSLAW